MPKYNLALNNDRAKFLEYATRLVASGEKAEAAGEAALGVDLTRIKPPQSGQQLRFAFVCIGYFAAEYGVSKYEAEWEHFKDKANHDLFYKTKLNKNGKTIKYVRHMDELDMGELSLAITRFRNYAANYFEMYIPDSTDYAFFIHAQKVIDENQEFL
jgi:hypothetical protein